MKVLYVYYEPQASGQTRHVLSLVQGLDRARYRLTVILPELLQELVPAFERAGARTVALPLRRATADPRVLRRLVGEIRAAGADVVHVHSQEAGLVARPAARLAGARAVVYTPQTIDLRRRRWQRPYARAERALARLTDRIVSVNERDRQRLIAWGVPAAKVVTIANGIDLAPFATPPTRVEALAGTGEGSDRLQSRLGQWCAGGHPVVMQVGRLSAQKDPVCFVEGAARVLRACPEARFLLVGDGPLRGEVEQRVRELGLGDGVLLAGWQPQAAELLATADVVSLTSRWEGAPYALLEAMAWSKPAVVTAVNGCPEIVVDGQTGYLVPPADPAAWAVRVIELLHDPARAAAMGRRGRQRAEAHFTLGAMVARIEQLYASLAPPPAEGLPSLPAGTG